MIDHYANFAQFYDQVTTTDIESKVALLRQKIEQHNPNAKSLLELACGTGNVLTQLVDDYTVSGLDLSPEMLKIARSKLPSTELHIADMTAFGLGKKFDVILCVFDSVNHLLSFEQWGALFDRAKEHLNDNGVFIMDMNTITKLEKFSSFHASKMQLENGYQVAKIIKSNDGIYHWNLDIYEQQADNNYKVIKNDIPETAFPLHRVKTGLASRFSTVDMFTPDSAKPNELADRIYFACKVET